MADFTVGCMNPKSRDRLGAAEMRIRFSLLGRVAGCAERQ